MSLKDNPYETAARVLLRESGCVVRKWRKNNTGVAFTSAPDWGIEVPHPRGPVSFGVFAHEVGHQCLHRKNGRTPRWLEEIEAWEYALAQFDRFRLDGHDSARMTAAKSLTYAASKAGKRCGPEQASKILERMPDWVDDLNPSGVWGDLLLTVKYGRC